jgi:hypothetical protein
MNLTPRSIYS